MEMQQRIERLEKERWIYLGLASLAVLAGLLGTLMGASNKSVSPGAKVNFASLSTGELVIHNADGETRMVIQMNEKGLPGIYFLDENKQKRQFVGLSTSAEPKIQMFYDDGKKLAAEFMVDTSGQPKLIYFDLPGTPRQSFALAGGDPSVEFNGLNGKPQAILNGMNLKFFGPQGTLVDTVPRAAAPATTPAKK